MPLPEKNNQVISLEQASEYTGNYRSQVAVKGGLFWKEYVQKLLDQPDCVAMRYYHGQDDRGNPVIVLVGVDGNGNDICGGILLEVIPFCPPFCSISNQLNS